MTAAPSEAPKQRVVLIDLSSLFWSAWMVTKDVSAVNIVRGNVRRCFQPGDLVMVCTDEGRSFRKDLHPDYKATREEKEQSALGELARLKDILKRDGYLLTGAKGFEADDVIATATEKAVSAGHEVLICSSDKDLVQLLRPGVRALRTHVWQEFSADEMAEKFGVQPRQIGDLLALTGDTSDNIKGAPGVGMKNAASALLQWDNLDALGVALEQDPGACGRTQPKKKGELGEPFKWAKSINDNWDQVLLARKLVELRKDAPIDFEQIYVRRDPQPLVSVDEEEEDQSVNFQDDRISGTTPAKELAPTTAVPPTANSRPATSETTDGKANGVQKGADTGEPRPSHNRDAQTTQAGAVSAPDVTKQTQSGEDLLASLLNQKGFVPVEYHQALEPRNASESERLAKNLFNSRVYKKFPTWESIHATILRGRTMGVSAIASLDVFHIVDDRPCPLAWLLISLAERDPNCEYIYCTETTATSSTWEAKSKKNPKPQRFMFTEEMARKAGLFDKPKSAWITRQQQMLIKSCGSIMARMAFPTATLGLYSAEEMGGSEE